MIEDYHGLKSRTRTRTVHRFGLPHPSLIIHPDLLVLVLVLVRVPRGAQDYTRRVRPRCDTNLYRPVPNLNLVQIQIEKLHPKGNKQLFQKPMYTPRHLSKIYLTIYKFTRRHSDILTYTSESERGCPIYYCDLTFLGRTEWI